MPVTYEDLMIISALHDGLQVWISLIITVQIDTYCEAVMIRSLTIFNYNGIDRDTVLTRIE